MSDTREEIELAADQAHDALADLIDIGQEMASKDGDAITFLAQRAQALVEQIDLPS